MRRRRATVQWRHLVNGNVAAARSGEWPKHFSNASCLINRFLANAHLDLVTNDALLYYGRQELLRQFIAVRFIVPNYADYVFTVRYFWKVGIIHSNTR